MGIYEVRPAQSWVKGTLVFKSIALMNESACLFTLANGATFSVDSGFDVDDALALLRTEMASLQENGHAWYSAQCVVTADEKYTFQFDYEHLPAFDIIPSPSKWLDEFAKYPRMKLKATIEDWLDGRAKPDEIKQRLKNLQLQQY